MLIGFGFVFAWGCLISVSSGAAVENIHEHLINTGNSPSNSNSQHHNNHRNDVPAILSNMWGSPAVSRLEMPVNKSAFPPLPLAQAQAQTQHQYQVDNSDQGKTLFFENPSNNNRPLSTAKQDAIINKMWGGHCKMDHWLRCNNLRTVTGDYYNKEVLEHFEMDCNDEKEFPWICMRNGWTVNRCHLLCMSGCHRDLLLTRNYDNYVSHDGRCQPVSKKG